MKKNKINIILISVVVAIWIMVLFKATGSWWGSNEQEAVAGNENQLVPTVKKNIPDEKLNLDYPDPFLGKMDQSVRNINSSNTERKIKTNKKEIPVTSKEWPKVAYAGTIKNTDKNKIVAILSINNREKRMLPGEVSDEIKLEKISGDSVLVSWGKDKKYISKK